MAQMPDAACWLVAPGALRADVRERFAGWLSAEERARAARFVRDADRERFVVGRGLARCLLTDVTGIDPVEWRFEVDERGRPEVAAPVTPWRFSISHTDGAVACVAARGAACGVDVERVRALRDWRGVAEQVFSRDERQRLEALGERHRPELFFRLWTLKEAYVKARGAGLTLPVRGITVRPEGEPIGLELAPELRDDPQRWRLACVRLGEHTLALALDGIEPPPVLRGAPAAAGVL